MKIYDDFFDERFLNTLYYNLLLKAGWNTNSVANRYSWPFGDKGDGRALGIKFFNRVSNNIIEYGPNFNDCCDLINCYEFFSDKIKYNGILREIMGNLQFTCMDGSFHDDGKDDQKSFILMLSEGTNFSGGEFINQTTDEIIPFKKGRLIEITGSDIHKGNPFKEKDSIRITISWRTSNIKTKEN